MVAHGISDLGSRDITTNRRNGWVVIFSMYATKKGVKLFAEEEVRCRNGPITHYHLRQNLG
jgi:hypothetical protein